MAESIFVVASIAVFSLIGLATGWVHGHGEITGTISGGLAGLILAIMVPACLGTSFLSQRRVFQVCIAIMALLVFLLVVGAAYDFFGVSPILRRLNTP